MPCDYCSYSLKNTTKGDWSNFACSLDQMNQSQNWTEYDENYNSCYAVTGLDGDLWNNGENKTYFEYQLVGPNYTNQTPTAWENLECLPTNFYNQTRNITSNDDYACAPSIIYVEYRDNVDGCDFCTPVLANTTPSNWSNEFCSLDNMNQSRNWTEYDTLNCGEFTNITHFEYQLVGPNYTNTTWNAWSNYTECLPDDNQTQIRSLTQYDTYECAANQTFYEYINVTCGYCIPSLVNTSWGEWTNHTECLPDNNQTQIRNLTQYDSNDCGEEENTTFYEYRNITCGICTPNLINTSWSEWTDYSECLPDNNQTQVRNLTQYDTYGCTENKTFYEYINVSCNYTSPTNGSGGSSSSGGTPYNPPTSSSYWRGEGSQIIPEKIESFERLQFVKGLDNFITTEFFNNKSTPLSEIEFSIEGNISEYIRISPKNLTFLPANSSVNVTLEILHPDVIKIGSQEIKIILKGKNKNNPYIEKRSLILNVSDMSYEKPSKISPVKKLPSFYWIILLIFMLYKLISLIIIRQKIKYIDEEKRILEQLAIVVQKEFFKKRKISLKEYHSATREYNEKILNLNEDIATLKVRRGNLFGFAGKRKSLLEEKKMVLELIAKVQRDHLVNRKFEERTYELKMEDYTKRLGEIEEAISSKKGKGIQKQ